MTMRLRNFIFASAGAVVLACPGALGQQPAPGTPSAPIPAYRPPLAGLGENANPESNDNVAVAPNQPLTGIRNLTLGLEANRSYWQPHATITGTGDSNSLQTPGGLDWRTLVSGSGGVDLHRVGGISDLTLSATSGGIFSNDTTVGSGATQTLSFTDKYSLRRSSLSLYDEASYLPETSLGFGGLGDAGLGGINVTQTGLTFNTAQGILVGRHQVLNNSDAVEYDQYLTPLSSLTFSGGYSLLHYFDTGLFNFGVITARGGYNHKLDAADTFGAVYSFADYRYATSTESLNDHTLQLSYGRQVTGKLAFQVAAGPEVTFSQVPTGGPTPTTGPTNMQILWSLNSSLQYQQRRYGLGLTYTHGVNGGAGVLAGAQGDTATGTFTRQMTRTFSSGIVGGYTRTAALAETVTATNQLYEYWFGGVNLTEPLGSSVGLTLSYQVQYQTANGGACVGAACGANITRSVISLGFDWRERPLLF